MDKKLNLLTAKFASEKSEAAYQEFIAENDRRNNFNVLAIGLPIFGLYSILDFRGLPDPLGAMSVRIGAVMICYVLLFSLRFGPLQRYRESLTLAIVTILGITVNSIIYLYTDLVDSYYVGLVQGCVFVCFLLRISFDKTVLALLLYLAGFCLAAYSKADTEQAALQSIVLVTMVCVCVIGSYLFQRFRRFDFQKSLIIEEQNEKLSILLDDVRRDNQRKLAAMNTLVHFVKTPLHQITGFSDIVMTHLARPDDDRSIDEGIQGAQYIKDAANHLSNNVNELLAYYRVDELDGKEGTDPVLIADLVSDFRDLVADEVSVSVDGKVGEIISHADVLQKLFQCLVEHYNEQAPTNVKVEFTLEAVNGFVVIVIEDNGAPITQEIFINRVTPLTKLDTYLTNTSAEIPMLLRTIARAAEVCGGGLEHEALEKGNRFKLAIKDHHTDNVLNFRMTG